MDESPYAARSARYRQIAERIVSEHGGSVDMAERDVIDFLDRTSASLPEWRGHRVVKAYLAWQATQAA